MVDNEEANTKGRYILFKKESGSSYQEKRFKPYRKGSSRGVEILAVGKRAGVLGEIVGDGSLLKGGRGKHVGETSAGTRPGLFRSRLQKAELGSFMKEEIRIWN